MGYGLFRRFDGKEYEFQNSANNVTELAALKKSVKQYCTNVRVVRGKDPYDAKYGVYARGAIEEYRPTVQSAGDGRWRTIRGSPTFVSMAAVDRYIKKRVKADKKAGVRRNYGWRSPAIKLKTRSR